jgi:hypothetical protein
LTWENVEEVGGNGSSGGQSREAVHSPSGKCQYISVLVSSILPKSQGNPVKVMLQSLAEKDQTSDTDYPSGIHSPQTVLRLISSIVAANVLSRKEVVEEMLHSLVT